ncbi:hypothetical protein QF032_007699 [Streptomyces achromogenes]|uniref:Uncharacterized protein n=1 Tax=Streptomyces achromogenes TaxID=67255 RepID=A0ABU0QG10_STRAH|nr:hypothetical protein [Streptomyces achromogenes]MDQ0835855.1 hypothetical protein [Streptomyces achromogenes]
MARRAPWYTTENNATDTPKGPAPAAQRTDEPDEGESANPGWSRAFAEATPDTHRPKQRHHSRKKRTHHAK